MQFAPVRLQDYARKHVKSNPGAKEAEVVEQLKSVLAAYKAGERCSCGEPIWVIGSSQVGICASPVLPARPIPPMTTRSTRPARRWARRKEFR